MMALYIETELFNRVAEVIANLEACPVAGKITVDQIKLALGEFGDVWPASIIPEAQLGSFGNVIALRSIRSSRV